MKRLIIGAASALWLVACTTTPVYEAATDQGGFGYSQQKIEQDRYRVSYNGNASTPRATVENYLLYRMSEITLENGFDYFKVLDTDTECHTKYHSTDIGPCSYHVSYGAMFPYRSYGYICNPSRMVYESKRYEAVSFISLHQGEKPEDDPYAFSARTVQENLAGDIIRY